MFTDYDSTVKENKNAIKFKIGFHAVPSMTQLHLHVISHDFDSDKLKNKKHWNSFNTDFFIEFNKFKDMLECKGKIEIDEKSEEAKLKQDMYCNRCGSLMKNIPFLKKHLTGCGD